ncbi:MAG: biopolymer transporter ExbD [Gammaproteobacteria bacterium]|nr:biopolymer transporter ExbD [Gammaproteobacteria bacterium]
MKLGERRDRAPDINITPLIDVVFLLLIFFMVSTTFSRLTELEIQLPEASRTEQEEKEPRTLQIVIDARGRYFINDNRLVNDRPETLKRALENELAAAGDEAPPVVISADAQTPHQAVITAMDVAQQVGLRRLSFATESAVSGEADSP